MCARPQLQGLLLKDKAAAIAKIDEGMQVGAGREEASGELIFERYVASKSELDEFIASKPEELRGKVAFFKLLDRYEPASNRLP